MTFQPANQHYPLSIPEQIAGILRAGLREGRWSDTMPGKTVLARELRVSPMTVSRALSMLEFERLITSGGAGTCRHILMEKKNTDRKQLRVTILQFAADDMEVGYLVGLRYRLMEAGYSADIARQSLMSLKMDVTKVANLAAKTETDAWVVCAGSRAVLKWFSEQPTPAFALFGEAQGLPIAVTGPDKRPVIRTVVRKLMAMGHSRIVMIGSPYQKPPNRNAIVEAFLDELAAGGIATGPYNYPEWSGSAASLPRCLDALCLHTPPTALILETPELFHPVSACLAQKGLLAPRDVSLFTLDHLPSFEMCEPPVSCATWNHELCVKSVLHWMTGVERGVNLRRPHLLSMKLVEGGTMGPVRCKQPRAVPTLSMRGGSAP